jgi:hypothetical protein
MRIAMPLVILALGLAIVGRTIAAGIGGGVGLLLGSLFVLVGAARLFVAGR